MKKRQTNKDSCPRLRRPYHLSGRGLEALQTAAGRNQPWLKGTGPRTPLGVARSSRNALKHGLRRASQLAELRELSRVLRTLRELGRRQAAYVDGGWSD